MLIELLGWIAAGFTLAAYAMRTMLPLRVAAICANVFFIAFSSLAEIYPTLVLHMALLPFNVIRLVEILRLTKRVKDARTGDFQIGWISSLVPAKSYTKGTVMFRKGDSPDNLYYLVSGTIRMKEADFTVSNGEVFGEIAFFSDAEERTLTAECATDCEVVVINEAAFMKLYFQNPAFGMYIVKLISRRLLDGMNKVPAAYRPTSEPASEPA